jgi:hypothetical protein
MPKLASTKEKACRSSGRLAAKPTCTISTLDKAKFVLLKKSGVVEEDAMPVGRLQFLTSSLISTAT